MYTIEQLKEHMGRLNRIKLIADYMRENSDIIVHFEIIYVNMQAYFNEHEMSFYDLKKWTGENFTLFYQCIANSIAWTDAEINRLKEASNGKD
jgi:hypothetical protein